MQLKWFRQSLYLFLNFKKSPFFYRKLIKEYEQTVEENQKMIIYIQEAVIECKNNFEPMQAKEKLLERAYKKDFQDMSPVVQEQSYKLYR